MASEMMLDLLNISPAFGGQNLPFLSKIWHEIEE